MADETTPTGAGSGDGGTADAGTGDGGTQPQAGFVPQADLDREAARARSFQAAADKANAELAALRASAPKPADGTGGGTGAADGGLDLQSLRNSLLGDVMGATRIAQAVPTLQQQFPKADPAIYDRLADFGSVDALRVAIEDSHRRVSDILASDLKAQEDKLRAEFASKIGAGGGAAGGVVPDGEPTLEQLNAMSTSELHALEQKTPGITRRILLRSS